MVPICSTISASHVPTVERCRTMRINFSRFNVNALTLHCAEFPFCAWQHAGKLRGRGVSEAHPSLPRNRGGFRRLATARWFEASVSPRTLAQREASYAFAQKYFGSDRSRHRRPIWLHSSHHFLDATLLNTCPFRGASLESPKIRGFVAPADAPVSPEAMTGRSFAGLDLQSKSVYFRRLNR